MESIWIALFFMVFIKNSHLLSHPFSSKTTLTYMDKLEEYSSKLSASEWMRYCPLRCDCYNLTVDCDSIDLVHFPQNLHPSINYLTLANNEISKLHYNSSLDNLKLLNVSLNNLQEIDRKFISTLIHLEILDLSQNTLHSKTVEGIFKNPALYYLNLSHNKLNELNDRMFQQLSLLSSLDLSFNKIGNISLNCFSKQTNLQTLNLSSNRLLDLKYDWFRNLQNLDTLILKKNDLKILRNVVFFPLNHLRVLDLSQNSIKSLSLLSFKGLVNLEYLNISNNMISHFPDGVFRFLVSLKVLDISYNPFFSTDNVFIHTSKIQFLYMNGLSRFLTLTSSSLVGLNQLELLDLSGSGELSDVNIKAFIPTKNLKNLDLSNTKLTSLKNGVFSYTDNIESIKLGGNPWKCDCYMYWLLIWMSEHSNTHLLSPSEAVCNSPPDLEGHVLLDALDHSMVCTNASIRHFTVKTKFKVGSPAFLECQVEGNPLPTLTWITPQKLTFHWLGFRNYSDENGIMSYHTTQKPHVFVHDAFTEKKDGRFYLMPNGNLAIRNVERGDGGFYTCVASNPLNNDFVLIRLTLDYEYFVQIKIVSVLVGMATSFGFLLLTLISVLIKMILKHFGVKFPCRNGNASPRTQQIRKILESMEHYKKQQLDRLRDNYNVQVQRIKDNCMQQMERLRESYSSQAERLRDIKEYGTLQIDRIRENYYFQVQRVRDYSASQIIRLRENYIFQRNRIRKFSAHHLYKLRENYKLQQQHLNKILENLTIESCRNVCQRTDSVMFEPDITLENVLVPKICLQTFAKETCDSNDNSSQISAYFTPDETGSEISGHDSDERESFETASKPKPVDKTDIIVRMEEDTEHTTFHIPEQAPCNNSQIHITCSQKPSNETIV